MLRHAERFHFFDPGFYLWNLLHEHHRYLTWVGGSYHDPVLWPRLGIFILPIALALATIFLWQRRTSDSPADQFVLIALPILGLALALFLNLKRYPYLVLLLPFMALQIAYAAMTLWSNPRWHRLLGLIAVGLVIESGLNVAHNLQVARSTTAYRPLTAAIAAEISPDARLLIAQTYWLGLADFDTLSLNLPFVLSDPHYRFRYPDTPSMAAIMQELNPDYIIIEHYFLDEYFRDPKSWLNPDVVRRWETFNSYLQQYCRVISTIPAHDYGQTDLLQCQLEPIVPSDS
jgi:4-amino-4-deoxy-L-arabinose transferase-like glycosyltransferase